MRSGLCQLPLAGLPIPHHRYKSSRHNHLQQTPTPVGVAVHEKPQEMLLMLGVKPCVNEGRWLFMSATQLSQAGCICTTCQLVTLLWLFSADVETLMCTLRCTGAYLFTSRERLGLLQYRPQRLDHTLTQSSSKLILKHPCIAAAIMCNRPQYSLHCRMGSTNDSRGRVRESCP